VLSGPPLTPGVVTGRDEPLALLPLVPATYGEVLAAATASAVAWSWRCWC
jgi:hypothetical protein